MAPATSQMLKALDYGLPEPEPVSFSMAAHEIENIRPIWGDNIDDQSFRRWKSTRTSREKPVHRQSRKVFVGGVPQSTDENTLVRMFSTFGVIEKAWLQKQHEEGRAVASVKSIAARNQHRGFGFVVFQDKHSIDNMLGNDFSRFVLFDGSIKLEVKRAVCKNALDEDGSSEPGSDFIRTPSQAPSRCKSSGPVSQTWQTHPWLYSEPQVFIVPCLPTTHRAAIDTTMSKRKDLTDFLLSGFPDPKPLNSGELKETLLDAMPDFYED